VYSTGAVCVSDRRPAVPSQPVFDGNVAMGTDSPGATHLSASPIYREETSVQWPRFASGPRCYPAPMSAEQRTPVQDRRGLRFPFRADAEILLENPSRKFSALLTELSFRGCFLEMPTELQMKQRLRLRVYYENEFFEALADVLYTRTNGVGVLFVGMEHHYRSILQNWILAELDKQANATQF